ncbi:hypothetical protein L345_12253, partial [Ophiophagus hannah]
MPTVETNGGLSQKVLTREVSIFEHGCDVLTLIQFCSFFCLGGFSQIVLTHEVSILKHGCVVQTLILFCSFFCLGGLSQIVLTQSDPVLKKPEESQKLTSCFSKVVLTESDPVMKKPEETHKLTCSVTGFDINNNWMKVAYSSVIPVFSLDSIQISLRLLKKEDYFYS